MQKGRIFSWTDMILHSLHSHNRVMLRGASTCSLRTPSKGFCISGSPVDTVRLQGPAFDAEARRPQGRVFSWIDRMLRAPHAHDGPPSAGAALRGLGPSKASVARTALLNMLSTNHDVLPVYVHQCYSAEPAIACTYFQALFQLPP